MILCEILDLGKRFEVGPVTREDGSYGAPTYIVLTTRSCWRKPAARYELVYLYELGEIAYYGVMLKDDPDGG